MTSRRIIGTVVALLGVVGATGCQAGYVLKGRVVEGAGVIVDVAPEQLDSAGEAVPAATINLYRDPDRRMEKIGTGSSDRRGDFAIPINAFGAGWMEEKWLIEVICRGYETLETLRPMPSKKSNRRLLIHLSAGRSTTPERSQGLWEELQRHK